MLLVRNVFQAKYGMGDALVQLFIEGEPLWGSATHPRILTDASGKFFTVVAEMTYADFAAFQAEEQAELGHPGFGDWFAKMVPLVESGYREFLHVAYSK